jgi:bacillopeptidase F
VTAVVETGETRPSAPTLVTVDRTMPTLSVASPAEGSLTNRETVAVTGQAADEHLRAVRVNGQTVTVAADGSFSQPIILAEGANTIVVEAEDAATNVTRVERHVTRDGAAPVLSNILPASDVTLTTGQSTTISFDAEPGMTQVGYRIILTGATSGGTVLTDPVNMREVSSGHYEGTYTAPSGTQFSGATIQVWALDQAGNRADGTAAGHLSVRMQQPNQVPVARFDLPDNPRKNRDLVFNGTASTDPDGRIVRYVWTWGDGSVGAMGAVVSHRYTRSGTFTVTLAVTDDKGATNSVSHTITIP